MLLLLCLTSWALYNFIYRLETRWKGIYVTHYFKENLRDPITYLWNDVKSSIFSDTGNRHCNLINVKVGLVWIKLRNNSQIFR